MEAIAIGLEAIATSNKKLLVTSGNKSIASKWLQEYEPPCHARPQLSKRLARPGRARGRVKGGYGPRGFGTQSHSLCLEGMRKMINVVICRAVLLGECGFWNVLVQLPFGGWG